MGWDYFTYEQQPATFISDILTFLAFEVSLQKTRLIQAQQRSNLSTPSHG